MLKDEQLNYNKEDKLESKDTDVLDINPIPEKFLRHDEVDKVVYTINGLKKVIEELDSVSYNKYYDKKKLQVHQFPKSFLNKDFILGRMYYIINKNELSNNITVQNLYDAVSIKIYNNLIYYNRSMIQK